MRLCIILCSSAACVCSGALNWYIGKPAFNGKPADRPKFEAQWKPPLTRKITREQVRKLFDLSLPDNLVIQMHKRLLANKEKCKNAKEFENMMNDLYTEQRLWGWIKTLLNVGSTKQLGDDYPFVKPNHWKHLLPDAKQSKSKIPNAVRNWCGEIWNHRVKLVEGAEKANMDLKTYVLHRATEHTEAGLAGSVEREQVLTKPGEFEASHYNILTGNVDKFADVGFGQQGNDEGLTAEKKWNCPYIFMDVPDSFTPEFPQDMMPLGIKAAMTRTRAASGMVVIFCQDYQISMAKQVCSEACPQFGENGGEVIAVITHSPVDTTGDCSHHQLNLNTFPRRMYFAVVGFWGKFEMGDTGKYSYFPTELHVNDRFLATGLQDCIYVPPLGGNLMKTWDGNHEASLQIPPCIGTGDVVCKDQKPLELYLYFLRGFQFPTIDETTVFDLCSGTGTGALAASYLGYEAVAVDNSLDMNLQASHRMQVAPRSVHEAFGPHEIVFDNFSRKFNTFKKPKANDTPVHLKGRWLQHQTFASRFADSLVANTTSAGVDDDDATNEMS